MGRYTALNDPLIDQKIESHLKTIVETIRSHIEPMAIILRGSFGRGEGSVYYQKDEIRFLSDYELDVVTRSSSSRSIFKSLSVQLSKDLGVKTGLRWARPDFLTRERIGPYVVGKTTPTISLYEIRYGSKTLYGDDFFRGAAEINPMDIRLDSGMYLLLNRMAESILYMRPDKKQPEEEPEAYYWINKTILACAESLLLIWGRYHFSYAERGRRFAALANSHLNFMADGGVGLSGWVARATSYKLAPNPLIYPDSVESTWHKLFPEVEQVFKYVMEKVLQFQITDYREFPNQYLKATSRLAMEDTISMRMVSKLLDIYRSFRVRSIPSALFGPHFLYQIVYSIVPIVFNMQMVDAPTGLQDTVHSQISRLGRINTVTPIISQQKEYLTERTAWYWKVYCHG